MKESGQHLVLHVEVDTGDISLVGIEHKDGTPIENMEGEIEKATSMKRWPKDGYPVGKIMDTQSVNIIIYDDSKDDCIIIRHPSGLIIIYNP